MKISKKQRKQIESLWLVYGNYGKRHSNANHRFLQSLLERGQDLRDLFKPSAEVVLKVDQILLGVAGDARPARQQGTI